MNAALQNLGIRFGSRARAWARRRQGIDPSAVRLESERIYILPTRTGFLYGVIVFTMLLGSMNYNNNMGFALTFLLAGVGILSIYHCHRNMHRLYVSCRGADPVFAGEALNFEFLLENRSAKERWQIRLGWDGRGAVYCDLEPGARHTVTLALETGTRGFISMPRIQISTWFPLGLFRAWSWINMEQAALAYPRPANHGNVPLTGDPGRNDTGRGATGDDDFSGLREYRQGDSPRRMAWKALARSGQQLIMEYRGGVSDSVWIDWQNMPPVGTESRISIMTRQVLNAHAENHDYGLKLPGAHIAPAHGSRHRHHCLKSLALFGAPKPGFEKSAA